MKKFLPALLAVLGVVACFSEALAFYVPAGPALKALGNANVQAIDADLRAMEQAALLLHTENPAEAGNLPPNVNNIAVLAQYSDVPGRFADTSAYGFLADGRDWWIGVAVPESDSTREHVAQAAGDRGWLGSPNTSAYPSNAAFSDGDSVVWKLLNY